MSLSDPNGAGGPPHDLVYDGSQGRIFRIALVNALLTIPTLGLYRFWGTTRIRRYVWNRIRLDGDRLDYTGTARELFVGFLIVVAVLIPFRFLVGFIEGLEAGGSDALSAAFQAATTLLFWFLVLAALYRARRYRLSRTEWRGIRAGQTGSSIRYALIGLAWWFVTILTLGLVTPIRRVRMASFRMNNTWFGDRRVAFEASAGRIYGAWMVNWLLFVPTFGLSYFWYRAAEARYFASCTRFETVRFRSSLTGARLCGIFLPYVLTLLGILVAWGVAVVTVTSSLQPEEATGAAGIAAAVVLVAGIVLIRPVLYYALVLHRLVGGLVETTRIEGRLDPHFITQAQAKGPARGEGLAAALGVGEI